MVNLKEVIKDLDGNSIKESPAPDAKPATIGALLLQVALVALQGDDRMSGADKVSLFKLAEKIHSAKDKGKVEFTAEETTLLKDRAGKAFNPVAVHRLWAALDPASVKS